MKPGGSSRWTQVADSPRPFHCSTVRRNSNSGSDSFIFSAEFSFNRLQAEGREFLAGFPGFTLQPHNAWLRPQVLSAPARLGRPSCSPAERCEKAHLHTECVWKQSGNLRSFSLLELMMIFCTWTVTKVETQARIRQGGVHGDRCCRNGHISVHEVEVLNLCEDTSTKICVSCRTRNRCSPKMAAVSS